MEFELELNFETMKILQTTTDATVTEGSSSLISSVSEELSHRQTLVPPDQLGTIQTVLQLLTNESRLEEMG
jgi:hypothetical protein